MIVRYHSADSQAGPIQRRGAAALGAVDRC